MAIKLEVAQADLAFEAGFPKPEFRLFRDVAVLLDHLYRRLESYGLRLTDIRVERGSGTVNDHHIVLYLFNYWMTVRVRTERVEVGCSTLPRDYLDKYKAAIIDVLRAVKDYRSDLSFPAFAVVVGLHGSLEGRRVEDYLAQYVVNGPKNLGPTTGNGVVFYYGAEGDRFLSTLTVDRSATVPDALFVRVHGVWDAGRVAPEALAGMAEVFVRQALENLGLEVPR